MYWLDRFSTIPNIEHEQEFPMGTEVDVIFGPLKGLRGRVKQK